MSTSTLVGTALSVALVPRQGAASIQQGADLLNAFRGARFTNWANNSDPCGETAEWEGVTCQGGMVHFILLGTNETTEPSSIPVDFEHGYLPTSVRKLALSGPVFLAGGAACSGLTHLTDFILINTTNFSMSCLWDDLPLGDLEALILKNPGAQFEPNVPWSHFQKIQDLALVGMSLTGTIGLSELPPSVQVVDVRSNKFTSVDWTVSVSSKLTAFSASNNEISQVLTADELPRSLSLLSLENNPHAVGSLNITSLPEAFRQMNTTVFNEFVYLDKTQLCFTGTPEDFQGPTGKPFLWRQCSIDQGRGLLAAFEGAVLENWTAGTDPCGNSTGGVWEGILCGTENNKPLQQVLEVTLESYGKTLLIPVRFETIPLTAWSLSITGTSFQMANCTGLSDRSGRLYEGVTLNAMTPPEVLCDWDDFALYSTSGNSLSLQLTGQSVRFSSSDVPWSKLQHMNDIYLTDMGLTGTVDLAPLCNVGTVQLPGNNFTYINWDPNCTCSGCTLDISRNAINQTITAEEIPKSLTVITLSDNPLLVGHLETTALPIAFQEQDYAINNTQLCFTGPSSDFGFYAPRQCSIDQGRGLLAAFHGASPESWIAETDPCGNGTGPVWKGIQCGTSQYLDGNDGAPEALLQVTYVNVESYGRSPPISVRFDPLPSTVQGLIINGTSFKLADCKGLHDLPNLIDGVALLNMTTAEVVCDWDDFAFHVHESLDAILIITGQSVRFSSSVVPWSKFAGLTELSLHDMGLTGTVDLAALCHVAMVNVPANNFTHINWAPDCACNTSRFACLYYLDVSRNAINQTITAGDLPPHIVDVRRNGAIEYGGYLRLNDNPMLHGALDATSMPSGILNVINESTANVSHYFDTQNTGLCFTGMHSASAATNLTRPQVDWFSARSCSTATPTDSHTAAIIAGSVIGSLALLALIGAGIAYGIVRKRASQHGSVATEGDESLTADYEMNKVQ